MFIQLGYLVLLIRLVLSHDANENGERAPCTPPNEMIAQTKPSERTTIKSSADQFFDFLKRFYKFTTEHPITANDGGHFCYVDRSFEQKYRSFERIMPISCERKSNLLNLFKPIPIFNISLLVIYDLYFEARGDPVQKIKHLIKGVQELYDSYDFMNEVGIIKFYVSDIIRMNIQFEDAVYITTYGETLNHFLRSIHYKVEKRMIPLWLTNARIQDKTIDQSTVYNRLEGLAKTRSFCSNECTVVVNCNSLSKSVITIAHEIG